MSFLGKIGGAVPQALGRRPSGRRPRRADRGQDLFCEQRPAAGGRASGRGGSQGQGRRPSRATAKDDVPQPVTHAVRRDSSPISSFRRNRRRKDEPKRPPPIPEEIKKRFVNPPTPISLFPSVSLRQPSRRRPLPPTYYLPSFRLIRCELIGGPETGSIETPLIGIVLDNQYNIDPDGVTRLVIPAGVEVHGIGKSSPSRDRIDGNGKWTFVWRSNDGNNAMELTVSALALNRDYDEAKHVYGDTEKSPGIAGRRFGSLGDQAIQEALLASVAAVTRSVQSHTSVLESADEPGRERTQGHDRQRASSKAGRPEPTGSPRWSTTSESRSTRRATTSPFCRERSFISTPRSPSTCAKPGARERPRRAPRRPRAARTLMKALVVVVYASRRLRACRPAGGPGPPVSARRGHR